MAEQLRKLTNDLRELNIQEKEAIGILSDLRIQKEQLLDELRELSSSAVDTETSPSTLALTEVSNPRKSLSYYNRSPVKHDLSENTGAKKRTYTSKDSGEIYIVDYYHQVSDFESGDTVLITSATKGFDGREAIVERINKTWIWCKLLDNSFTSEQERFKRAANSLIIIRKHYE